MTSVRDIRCRGAACPPWIWRLRMAPCECSRCCTTPSQCCSTSVTAAASTSHRGPTEFSSSMPRMPAPGNFRYSARSVHRPLYWCVPMDTSPGLAMALTQDCARRSQHGSATATRMSWQSHVLGTELVETPDAQELHGAPNLATEDLHSALDT